MAVDLQEAFAAHRPALLRHCFRMMGSFPDAEDLVQDTLLRAWDARGSYSGAAPVQRWLFTIATNTCLNALEKRRPLLLPQLERDPSDDPLALEEAEAATWLTPAPEARLFPNPSEQAESRETVALAFIALLQRLPPRQRAALLMKDVLGWPADEIAEALGLTLSSMNSALHRARETMSRAERPADEPSPDLLLRYIRAWESHDLEGLVALMREDVTLAMPPYATWFRGPEALARFFRSPRFHAFWSSGPRVVLTRANGLPALAFYRPTGEDVLERHSIMVARFQGSLLAEATVFLGARYFMGFDLPRILERTNSEGSAVMTDEGD